MCAQNFFEKYFFYGHFNRLYMSNFSIAFKTEKFHFTPENRARTAKRSVPIDSAGKNNIEICTLVMWEIFFGEAV